MTKQRGLQEFFDDPATIATRHKLSASASEPVGQAELLALEPGAAERFVALDLDYPERFGPSDLRTSIKRKYASVPFDNVLITSGLDEGLALLFTALVEPGDRVIVLTPCYPPHMELPAWRGAEVVPWPARPEKDFVPDLEELEALLSKPAKAVLTTFPQNPTGFLPDEAYTAAFLQLLERTGTPLFSDEIYAGLPLGNAVPKLADRYEKAISLHGLSKTCGLPSLRFGWLAGRDSAAMAKVKAVKNLFNAYVPAPVAFLAELAFKHEGTLLARNSAILEASIEAADSFIARHGNLFSWTPPAAGTVAFPRWLGPGGTQDLSDRLIRDASIALAPSLCLDAGDDHVRFGMCRRNFPEGLAALDRFLGSAL
ncbi:pyridoxal phosphate-dependent aminotransferase [Nisaea acidiphila]|uniref:Pyridoxal phosphate-dependent aminotransferase n=1 Tax=Nisaea acidiphila TaxID=1862145 RepID=A0A9J7ARM1_9PROT|nr:pyridoxal phosphate-dependent aminotransferase [Nisaea acidiphila]UUX49522.1 pyridoxal phosphate-dependent aminotransferase [Nisaea acidiphila]